MDKLAYEYGVRQALEDLGVIKTAGDPGRMARAWQAVRAAPGQALEGAKALPGAFEGLAPWQQALVASGAGGVGGAGIGALAGGEGNRGMGALVGGLGGASIGGGAVGARHLARILKNRAAAQIPPPGVTPNSSEEALISELMSGYGKYSKV
jgi:hypothetical protein